MLEEIKKYWFDTYYLKEHYYVNENGQKDGSYKIFHYNGQLGIQCSYQNGLLHGPYQAYDENGLLLKIGAGFKGHFIAGEKAYKEAVDAERVEMDAWLDESNAEKKPDDTDATHAEYCKLKAQLANLYAQRKRGNR